MNELTFKRTLTIEEFKAEKGNYPIEIKRNPKTNKLFAVHGTTTMAYSGSIENGRPTITEPMVSLVEGTNGQFWVIHKKGSGGAPTLATF